MPIISIEQLSFTYPDGTRALDSITLHIDRNETIGIAGPNGAGKTTLINHLCGYTLPQSGKISLMGTSLTKETVDIIRKKIGVVFQNTDDQLFMPSVVDDVAFGVRSSGLSAREAHESAIKKLQELGLDHLAKKPPFHLSQGQKRFVAFAGILAMQPQVIIMDEPTADLDPRHRRTTMELIRSLSDTTRLIVSHDLDFLWETCGRIVLINEGAIAADGPAHDVLADESLLRENGLELPLQLQGKNNRNPPV
ncbi:MAG: ABC transporter ATP-binding protein [Chitinispirillaceae bacterium]|nr:ABC transporter ATP-binding protein [Chitinispirillaceae bacterium]